MSSGRFGSCLCRPPQTLQCACDAIKVINKKHFIATCVSFNKTNNDGKFLVVMKYIFMCAYVRVMIQRFFEQTNNANVTCVDSFDLSKVGKKPKKGVV